jgi:hypothetical protein
VLNERFLRVVRFLYMDLLLLCRILWASLSMPDGEGQVISYCTADSMGE